MNAGARFAAIVVRLRYAVLAGWLVATVAAVVLLPSIDEAQTGALGDLAPNDAEAIKAEIRSSELFGFPLLSRTLVVQRDPHGLSPAAQARIGTRAVAVNRHALPGLERIGGALPITNLVGAPPFAREHSTTGITYLLFGPDVGRGSASGSPASSSNGASIGRPTRWWASPARSRHGPSSGSGSRMRCRWSRC